VDCRKNRPVHCDAPLLSTRQRAELALAGGFPRGHFSGVSRRRKAVVALAVVAVIVCASWLWPRNVYRYQGRTVEEWFRQSSESWPTIDPGTGSPAHNETAAKPFQEMGTNAVPFLASQINEGPHLNFLERLASKLPQRLQFTPRGSDPFHAAWLLRNYIKPPQNMLYELLKPTLVSTNQTQRILAEYTFSP